MVIDSASQPITGAGIVLSATKNYTGITVVSSKIRSAHLVYSTSSDSSGKFQFPSIWPGDYQLTAEADGYLRHVDSGLPADTTNHIVRLQTQTILSVRVIDQDGQPVFLAAVALQRIDGKGICVKNVETPQSGVCTISELTAGEYAVEASHPDYLQNDQSRATITLENDRHECLLVLEHRGFNVSGKVLVKSSREPVPDFALFLMPGDWKTVGVYGTTKSDQSGQFVFTNVHRGRYLIGGSAGWLSEGFPNKNLPYVTKNSPGLKPFSVVDSDVEGLEVLVFPKAHISGHVYDVTGNPVSGAWVWSVDFGNNRQLSANDGSYSIFSKDSLIKDEQEYPDWVTAIHPDYGSGRSREYMVKDGREITDIDVILDESVEVTGRVTNREGVPITTATIRFRPAITKLLNWPEIPVDENGRYRIATFSLDQSELKASAPGYVSESRTPRYPKGTKSAVEDFVLLRKAEMKAVQISGVVLDRNEMPMSRVLLQCKPMQIDMERPGDSKSMYSKENGQFVLEQLQQDRCYCIQAQMTTPPYLEKELFGVPVGTNDLVIHLVFEPVELSLQLDETTAATAFPENAFFRISLMMQGDLNRVGVDKWVPRKPNGILDTLVVKEPGTYQLYVSGSGYFAYQSLKIDQNTPKQLPIVLSLSPEDPDKVFSIVGRCVYADGSTVNEPYRVVCRLLQPQIVPFMNEGHPVEFSSDEKLFAIKLSIDGTYELIYITQDGVVFHRTIVELSHTMAGLWPGEQARALRLPDVLYPGMTLRP
ncbi:MAG TPA: carboxypeptidase regulatory-like domain-containing protein [bacterium]|nr:carboxypeptidase regulatory-like domain-containing protein [bacterium]